MAKELVEFPINSMVIFRSYVSHYQRVPFFWGVNHDTDSLFVDVYIGFLVPPPVRSPKRLVFKPTMYSFMYNLHFGHGIHEIQIHGFQVRLSR